MSLHKCLMQLEYEKEKSELEIAQMKKKKQVSLGILSGAKFDLKKHNRKNRKAK